MRAALQSLSRAPASATAKATVILPIPRDGELPATTSAVSPSVASPREAPAARDPAMSSGSHPGTGTGTVANGWDPAELSRIERALATHVGPMARVMVREAARNHTDATSLATAVAHHIAEDGKRRQFLDTARGLGSHVTPVPPTMASGAAPVPQAAAAPAGEPLGDDFRAHVLAIVTRRMGPIAKVLVKRSADAAGGSKPHFVQRLLEALPETDRWAVQGEINKLG